MNNFAWRQSGISLVEVVVGISIVTSIVAVVGFSITTYVAARTALLADTQATYLVEEGFEMLRAVRNNDWNTLAALTPGDVYYLDITPTTIGVDTTPEVIDGVFTRSFILFPVFRDSDDDIVASTTVGATADTDASEVIISVSGPTGTTTMHTVLANIFAS